MVMDSHREQGLEFRQFFAEISVNISFSVVTEKWFTLFSGSNFKISKKFINNRPKNRKKYDKKLGAFISL